MSATRHDRGFTLIELMIVVAIVAVLLLVALPAYQDQLQKGRRTDAMAALQDIAGSMEKFMLDRSTYTESLDDLGYDTPTDSPEGYYRITVREPVAGSCEITNCYVLDATPQGVQVGDTKCTQFTLWSNGVKEALGTLENDCW